MGIEAIGAVASGIGRAVSVAPAIGRSVSVGPRIGGFPAPKFEMGIRNIANPIKGIIQPHSYIENRGPSLFGSGVEVIKNPFKTNTIKPQIRAADVIAEAEFIVRKNAVPARVMEYAKRLAVLDRKQPVGMNTIVRSPEPARVVLPSPTLSPKPESKPILAPKVEARPQVVTRVVLATAPRQAQSEQVADKKATPERKKEDSRTKRGEKEDNLRFRLAEDTEVSQKRRLAIKAAIKTAKLTVSILGLKGISGKLVAKYLPAEYWERNDYQSSLVRGKSPDRTVDLTARAIELDTNEYLTEQEAEERLVKTVAENRPVRVGPGEAVSFEEVRKVVEGEPTLKSLGLEELFQKEA